MAYTGEWERYVCEVTLAGRPDVLRQAARQWEKTFTRINDMADLVDELARKSESWRGGGAEAFRVHLADLRTALQRTASEHKKVVVGLDACARHLEEAMLGVRIPQWLLEEIQDMQDRAVAQGVRGEIPSGHFGRTIMAQLQQVAERAGGTLSADDVALIRKNLDDGENLSRAAYEKLGKAYAREVSEMPGGSKITVPAVADAGKAGTGRRTAGQPAAQQAAQPAAQQPVAQLPAAQNPAASTPTTGDPGGLDLPDTEVPDLDLDPFRPGTGLAGLDDLKGADLKGIGGGAIGGGGGGGGFGGGKLPIGDTVATPAVAMAGTKTAGAGVRAGSSGAGGTRTATPMMGGMMGGMGGMGGAGANDGAASRTTCLREDDDLFAPDRCAPSGVLDV